MAATATATQRRLLRRLPTLVPPAPATRPLTTTTAGAAPTLPIVDIGPLRDPNASPESRMRVAEALHKACVDVGFLYVTNTGVPTQTTQKALDLARTFFALPQTQKDAIAIPNVIKRLQAEGKGAGLACRGYQKVGENVTKYARDLHEGIDYYREGEEHGSGPLAGFGGANPWPSDADVAGFQAHFEGAYIPAMLELGQAIMRGFALGFGFPEGYFAPHYARSFWCMRIIRYPPVSQEERETLSSGMGCGEHSDYGCLTLLNMDDSTQALQAQTRSGEWIFVNPVPGAFAINIGDMLARWSNGKFRSTPHRVLPAFGKERLSIPFFFEPNLDTRVEPLAACKGYAEAQGKVFEPVLFADHLRAKVSNNFSFLP